MPTSVSATKLSQAFHGSNDEASHRGIHGTTRRTGNCAKATLPDQLSPAGINGDIEMAAARAETAEKLGYVGLGMMGSPMARRLVGAGHDLTIWNRSPEKATGLIEAGAKLVAH